MLNDLQKHKLTYLFGVYDLDKNGFIELKDYESFGENLAKQRGLERGSPTFDALLAKPRAAWTLLEPFAVDGRVDLKGWLASYEALLADRAVYDSIVNGFADLIIDLLDVDRDGKLSVAERRAFLHALQIDDSTAEEDFRKMDLDGDGFVSRSEVIELLSQFFYGTAPNAPGNAFFGRF